MSTTRARWWVVGAATAVALGVGGVGVGHATVDSGPMPVFRPLDTPCRLADTRPAPNTVGDRATGIGAGETLELDGWGTTGDCDLPIGGAALQLNVTAVDATEQTNLRFFPAGASRPTTANLNPTPGAPPTPNAVTVGLDPVDGRFGIFNAFGRVDVVVDVVGVHVDHVHGGDDIVDGSLRSIDIADEPGIATTVVDMAQAVGTNDLIVATVRLRPPGAGLVKVDASARWSTDASGGAVLCQLNRGDDEIDLVEPFVGDSAGAFATASISTHRVFEASGPASTLGLAFSLVCRSDGTISIDDIQITATYFPTSYAVPVLETT